MKSFPLVLAAGIFGLLFSTVSKAYTKPLKIACYRDYAPYAVLDDNGEMDGVLTEFWRVWSDRTGIPITFLPMDPGAGIHAVETGKADVFCGLFYTKKRSETLSFSDALLRMNSILFVRNDIKGTSVDTVEAPISVVKNDLAAQHLHLNHPKKSLEVLPTYHTLLAAIDAKTPAAFVYDYPRRPPGFKPLPPPDGYRKTETLYSERLRIAVKRGNLALLETVNNGLAEIPDEDLWTIASKWNLYLVDDTMFIVASVAGSALFLFVVIGGLYLMRLRTRLTVAAQQAPTDIRALIAKGENDAIEFKSSLRWDYRQEKSNKALEEVIAKTISAFLNADGGLLLIGVDDDGNLLGLEKDYQSFNNKQSADGFLLALSSLINRSLGKKVHQFVNTRIDTLDGKDVCTVAIQPSDGPVFMKKGNTEEFYIRAQASSQPLGLKETYEYILSKWHAK